MAGNSTCTNCGRSLKENWLVCHYCKQARWNRISPYFIWGAVFTAFAFWAVETKTEFTFPGFGDLLKALLPILGVTFGIIGVVMLMMALVAALRGLGVKRVKPVAPQAAPAQTSAVQKQPADISSIKMVIPLSGGVLPGVDDTILRSIDDHIRYANAEKDWNLRALIPGQENRSAIPYNTRSIIDHLLVDHKLTSETTLSHLFKLGDDGLRERIIRVLGVMGSQEVLPVLEKFARSDPFRKTYYLDNNGNMTYADNSDFEYPLRDLAQAELERIRSGS
ncbi:MAG TPA: hypothetical protein PKK59_08580 [Anaerolineaceae bacterium]|nr:hypothetical protein [Anaerolineaceae bacterium]